MKRWGIIHFRLLTVVIFFLPEVTSAQQINESIDNIPYKLTLYNTPTAYAINKNSVEISAEGKTNLFNNPDGKSKVNNAPMILFEPEGDFTLSAKVEGELNAIYDVAALVIYQDENVWAKFCYENSVKKQPTIVSVVTHIYSDDCNSMTTGDYAYMSVVKKGQQYSFFYSEDGTNWDMVRSFNLETKGKIKTGFAVHGSRGDGFTGIFSDIKFKERAIEDMRTL